jgi:uncharacterized protein YraI
MKIRSLLALTALLAAFAVSAPAEAQTYAYASYDGYTNMRAGPSTRYPVIARVAPGSRVYVLGCVRDYSWCEGVVQGVQGWITARRLEFLYAGRRVYVPDYYGYFDAPIITFRFDDDDDDRWRGRHWRRPRHWGGGSPDGGGGSPDDDGGYTNWKPDEIFDQPGGGGVVGAVPGVSPGDSGAYGVAPAPGGGGGYIPPSDGGAWGQTCVPGQPCPR